VCQACSRRPAIRRRALFIAAIILIPSTLSMILSQITLGVVMGLIYSVSLYFRMALSDGGTVRPVSATRRSRADPRRRRNPLLQRPDSMRGVGAIAPKALQFRKIFRPSLEANGRNAAENRCLLHEIVHAYRLGAMNIFLTEPPH
jgi:hypothetical protein